MTAVDPRILEMIPHRAPFLWVDEIVELTESKIVTRKKVDPAEPCFAGHYPDFPILPGVLVCEAMFQSGAILLSSRAAQKADGKIPVMTKIIDTRFKQMVRPGDVLEMEVVLDNFIETLFELTGKARVNGKLACSTKFACALAPKPQ